MTSDTRPLLGPHLQQALALEAVKQHGPALAVLDEALRHTPEEALVHLARARCLRALGRRSEAREASWLALSFAAADGALLEALGDMAAEIGEDAVALRAYTRALDTSVARPELREKFAARVRARFWRAPVLTAMALVPVGLVSLVLAAILWSSSGSSWALAIGLTPPVVVLATGIAAWIAATGRLETDSPGALRMYSESLGEKTGQGDAR